MRYGTIKSRCARNADRARELREKHCESTLSLRGFSLVARAAVKPAGSLAAGLGTELSASRVTGPCDRVVRNAHRDYVDSDAAVIESRNHRGNGPSVACGRVITVERTRVTLGLRSGFPRDDCDGWMNMDIKRAGTEGFNARTQYIICD